MPLPFPNLDTRRFDDLVAEMRALIPQYAPEWTNHNPSDPGITLVELLAWVTEATLYRVNQIPEEAYRNFVALLNPEAVGSEQDASVDALRSRIQAFFRDPAHDIPAPVLNEFWLFFEWEADPEHGLSVGTITRHVVQFFGKPGRIPRAIYHDLVAALDQDLESLKRRAVQFLNEPYRAITAADFERAAKQAAPDKVARVRVTPDESLGAVMVVVIPFQEEGGQPSEDLLGTVKRELNRRKLICTRVTVMEPVYTEIELDITIVCELNAKQAAVEAAAAQMLTAYLDALTGGPDGTGWPFGRAVTVFDFYKLLEPIPGVDRVKRIVMKHNGKLYEREVPVKDLPRLKPFQIRYKKLKLEEPEPDMSHITIESL